MSHPVNFPSFPNTCYSHSKTPRFNTYSKKVAKCLHLINFQDAAEPFLKRPLELEAHELFEIYMSNFIDDWVEIPNHHKVPVPTKPSELLHSTYHLVKTNKWKPPTSLTIVTERSAHSRICSLFLLQNNRQL
jgi:hypothetical protein